MADLDLATALKMAKGKKMYFAFLLKGSEGTLIVSKKKVPPKQIAEAKKELGGGGENTTKYVKPFGGGTSYCPGRIFAEKQIIGFLAAMVMRYDMKIVTENFVIPRNSELEWVAISPPVMIEIKERVGI